MLQRLRAFTSSAVVRSAPRTSALAVADTAPCSPSTSMSATSSGDAALVTPSSHHLQQQRGIRLVQSANSVAPNHYSSDPKMRTGIDVNLKMTEVYDGFTDSFGVFKEGPPTTLRLEYMRSPEHKTNENLLHRFLWSPFEANADMAIWSPAYFDYNSYSSRDYWGHRAGNAPGHKNGVRGHYRKVEARRFEVRHRVNFKPQAQVPKWLACIVHDKRKSRMVGFFLYANGAYCAELLTYKQLPRLAYNKPFQGFIPTLGQTVDLSEVTYGKEISVLETYPGYGGTIARAAGCAAMVLRGTEPNLVPMLMPSREVRLFDSSATGTFGRRAGVMQNRARTMGGANKWLLNPSRRVVNSLKRRTTEHPNGGGRGFKWNVSFRLDWKWHPCINNKTTYWLSGYVLRNRHYVKSSSTADLKSKTYSWASRDPIPK